MTLKSDSDQASNPPPGVWVSEITSEETISHASFSRRADSAFGQESSSNNVRVKADPSERQEMFPTETVRRISIISQFLF